MLIEGVQVSADFDCDRAELANYVAYVKEFDIYEVVSRYRLHKGEPLIQIELEEVP